jgi:hypothetical protein
MRLPSGSHSTEDLEQGGCGSGLRLSMFRQLFEFHGCAAEASLPDGGGSTGDCYLSGLDLPAADPGTDKDKA